jgi:hypothetical protein
MQSNAIKAYGLPNHVGREIVWRSFFLVDTQGIVRGKWVGEDSGVFSNEPLLKAVQEIAGEPAEDAGGKKPSAM